jgi:uncharacterized membrane protein YkoI
MALRSKILIAFAVGALGIAAPAIASAAEAETHAAAKPVCFPASETQEEIKGHRLLEPFPVLKSAAAQFKAEALSARLCRIGDEFVYEIALLHRDGRFVHVVMNAATGKFIEVRHAHEAAAKADKVDKDKADKTDKVDKVDK